MEEEETVSNGKNSQRKRNRETTYKTSPNENMANKKIKELGFNIPHNCISCILLDCMQNI